ncbi:probable LRR receptor-like serine/threonine-protein kinase At1g67720 [Zingiber officinale]|uniref:probable LRR receptor-like serine/threonine-protein kinase At1g67720 n=1 Tax=Zingiber officinale TaxID=94328 RepID=UPI001C4C5FB6|nr:probable LRR receptor-like serine/threonine-protein kinase At1g67720 [Zingiber officinale]
MARSASLLFLVFLLSSPLYFVSVLCQSSLSRLFIDCGSTSNIPTPDGLGWISDIYIDVGRNHNLTLPNLHPVLSTLRSFPIRSDLDSPLKFCYVLPTNPGGRYLVRTTYFYGGFDNGSAPPVFDQIVDGTFWTTVNTTADYAAGMASYYEGVFLAAGKKNMRVCVAANTYTTSDPFISALEMILLDDSVYNGTDFGKYAMGLIARSSFGSAGSIIRYPDDRFDRYWQPFSDSTHAKSSTHNITTADFWNLPPAVVFNTAMVADQGKPLVLLWPPNSLPDAIYYIALYFADTSSLQSTRTFNVFVNNYSFYSNLTVSSSGLVVFSNQWNLSGQTMVTLTPGSPGTPLISAGEVFGLFLIGNLTVTRDVIAMEQIRENIISPPPGWSGDPCMPQDYSWVGVTCSYGLQIRVVSLNLSSMGLNGSISLYISNLTALTNVSLANNNFTGHIPNLSRLRNLEKLHLQDNQFTGTITLPFANLAKLQELYIENNNLTGEIPPSLFRDGLDFRYLPGNNFSSVPPPPNM